MTIEDLAKLAKAKEPKLGALVSYSQEATSVQLNFDNGLAIAKLDLSDILSTEVE